MSVRLSKQVLWAGLSAACAICGPETPFAASDVRELQKSAVEANHSDAVHWGTDPAKYVTWSSHSNRLIPVYTFGTKDAGPGIDLRSYTGENSAYRDESRLRQIYGYLPTHTISPNADYLDQTDVFRIQKAALEAGKKRVILVVFDGTDWVTTRAAAIWKSGKVGYDKGRGTGLHFQDYDADGTTQFGFMVTSPHNEGTNIDVNRQTVANPGGKIRGGYDPSRGGLTPWEPTDEVPYLISKNEEGEVHAYTDSASSATSMTSGIKTYNDSVNVDPTGVPVPTAAHLAQQKGLAVGVVSSVPISHATPAAAYANNVHRDDYQDLSRDLLGLPSVSHPEPLPGVDVLIGGGAGIDKQKDGAQGKNFVPGNRYLAKEDLEAVDVANGGKYIVATRRSGVDGGQQLQAAAEEAAKTGKRLFGFYGAEGGSLPFQGAHGDYKPAPGWKTRDLSYSPADIKENPTLAEMTTAALTVLDKDPNGFWLMVEAGDVDWANHDNNLDAAIGALISGDEAVHTLTDWVEKHGGWKDTVMIVTADHGHYMFLDDPKQLVPTAQ